MRVGLRILTPGTVKWLRRELLRWHSLHEDEAGLLVRANASRQRKVQVRDQELGLLIRTLESQPDFETPVQTGRKIEIDSQGGKRARRKRTAVTELRIGAVELRPPQERLQDSPLTTRVVRVLDTNPPAGQEPLEWLLVPFCLRHSSLGVAVWPGSGSGLATVRYNPIALIGSPEIVRRPPQFRRLVARATAAAGTITSRAGAGRDSRAVSTDRSVFTERSSVSS